MNGIERAVQRERINHHQQLHHRTINREREKKKMSASGDISNHDKMSIGKEETITGPPNDFSEQPTRNVKRKRQFYITEEQKRGR